MLDVDALVQDYRVHGSLYTDPGVFQGEMQRVFERNWVYVGHESEVAHPGDYKTGHIGRQPVILSRDSNGKLNVLLNRCRHRGAQVCQDEYGNSSFFRCAYHGWTYANDGELKRVTFSESYDESFDKRDFGLLQAPRLETYRGFIFASLSPEVTPLVDYLAGAKEFLDAFCDLSPTGSFEFFDGVQKTGFDGNWKFALENGDDGYHADFVHQSAITTGTRKNDSQALTRNLGGGHGVIDCRAFGPPAEDASDRGGGFYLVVFPNLVVLKAQVRMIRPVSVRRTEVYTRVVRLPGANDDLNRARLRNHQFGFGASGCISPDDHEMFRRNMEGFEARDVEWVILQRGLHSERQEGNQKIGGLRDETPQRGFWQHWKRVMRQSNGHGG